MNTYTALVQAKRTGANKWGEPLLATFEAKDYAAAVSLARGGKFISDTDYDRQVLAVLVGKLTVPGEYTVIGSYQDGQFSDTFPVTVHEVVEANSGEHAKQLVEAKILPARDLTLKAYQGRLKEAE